MPHRLYWQSLLASPFLLCAMVLVAGTITFLLCAIIVGAFSRWDPNREKPESEEPMLGDGP